MLACAEPLLDKKIHATVIVRAFARALDDAISFVEKMAFPIDTTNEEEMLKIVHSCLGTKFVNQFNDHVTRLALTAVQTVCIEEEGAEKEIDTKRYAKVEKVRVCFPLLVYRICFHGLCALVVVVYVGRTDAPAVGFSTGQIYCLVFFPVQFLRLRFL